MPTFEEYVEKLQNRHLAAKLEKLRLERLIREEEDRRGHPSQVTDE